MLLQRTLADLRMTLNQHIADARRAGAEAEEVASLVAESGRALAALRRTTAVFEPEDAEKVRAPAHRAWGGLPDRGPRVAHQGGRLPASRL